MIGNDINLPSVGNQPVPKNENYKVDVDRGVHIRFTRGGEFPEGMAVYMYLDKPGYFYNDHAKQVPPQLAEAAGYAIEPLLRARRKMEAMSQAQAEIEAAYQEGLGTHEVVEISEEYSLVHVGNDQFIVEFDGSSLTPTPVSRTMAEKAFRAMTGTEAEKPAKK